MTLFLVLPMAMIVYVSFWTQTTFKIEPTLTLDSWQTFFGSDTYLNSLWTTMRIWLIVLDLHLRHRLSDRVVCRPVCQEQDVADGAAGAVRHPVLDVVPDPRARVAADAGQGGRINIMLMKSGIIHQPIEALLFTELSVVIGMTQIYVRVHGRPHRVHARTHRS